MLTMCDSLFLLLLRVETINFNFLYIVSKLSPSKNILRLANVCEINVIVPKLSVGVNGT